MIQTCSMATSVCTVVMCVLVACVHTMPVYNAENNNYLQMVALLERAKEQGYLGQIYDQLYDNYDYPDSAYQDYVNEQLQEREWQRNMQQQYKDYEAHENDELVMDLEVSSSWPEKKLSIGQVVGVAVDSESNPHIFHRGDRVWDGRKRLFDEEHRYLAKEEGPIQAATVLQLSQEDGSVIKKWGENRFYLPHGLTIDMEGNFWLTDVALHQVFKFEPGKEEPTLVLGEAFQPAEDLADSERFCQPTDVAVSSEGDIFVADGYCNRRIVRFDALGNLVGQIQLEGDSNSVPHSITLAEELDLICVADREERSILCFNAGLEQPHTFGKFEREYTEQSIGRIFAIEYNPETGLLHAVTDASGEEQANGFTVDLHQQSYTADIIDEWSPFNRGFSSPHDIAISHDGNTLYVGEISPDLIWKFENTAAENGLELEQPESEEETDDNAVESDETIKEVEQEASEENGKEKDLVKAEPQTESEEDVKEIENVEEDHGGEELEQELEKEEQELMGAKAEQTEQQQN